MKVVRRVEEPPAGALDRAEVALMARTFEELIGLHLDDLYSAALCFTLDEEEAEELLQEASVRAFHQWSRRGRDSEFRKAMLGILVAIHLQRQRRLARDPFASSVDSVEAMVGDLPPQQFEPFPEAGTPRFRLLRDWMRKVWPTLDPGDRLIVWLVDVEQLKHAAAADMVGRDETDVRNRHYRARLSLSRGVAQVLANTTAGGAEAC